MTIQELGDYAKIIGPTLTGLSVFFGVVYFMINIRREKVKQTLDFWENINQQLKTEKSQLRNDYGTKIDPKTAQLIFEDGEEEARINRLLNVYERLALGINIGAYDIKVLNKLVGQNIIDNYVRFENYIELRRTEMDRPFAWCEFQELSKNLKKLRK